MRCGWRPSRRWSGCAKSCKTRNIPVAQHRRARRDALQGRRRAAGAGRGVPDRGQRGRRPTSIAARGVNGTYTFTMKPNIAGQPARGVGGAGAPDDRAPRQRARRHRAEHRAAGQRRPDPGAAARRHRRRARQENHRIARPARAEDRRAGRRRRRRKRCWSTARCPQGMEIVPGAGGAGDASHRLLPGAQGRGGHRPGSAQRARRRSTRTTSRRSASR